MPVLKWRPDEKSPYIPVGVAVYDTSKYIETVMAATNWVDNTYSFEDEYPHDHYNIEISVSSTASVDEFEAFGSAMICGKADSNVAVALSGAPSVDIPIVVKVVSK